MKTTAFNPQNLISRALKDAQRVLDRAAGEGKLTEAAAKELPGALKEIADGFDAKALSSDSILGQLQTRLESAFAGSLKSGAFVPGELAKGVDLVSFSGAVIQLQQLLASQAKSPTALEADQAAMAALADATGTVSSQLDVHRALKAAADAHQAEDPKSAAAQVLSEAVKLRGKVLREVADNTLKAAEDFAGAAKDPGAQSAVGVALQAAVEINQALNPKGARFKMLQKQAAGAPEADTTAEAAQPFFAQFLENQHAGEQTAGAEPPGMMVTMKYPSDNEDGAGDDLGNIVTEKAPSDHEDGGIDDGGIDDDVMVTMKAPSDHEDGGIDDGGIDDGVMVTMKAPSDHEDGGVDDGGIGDMVTMKFPSDNEDGGGDIGDGGDQMVTRKFPSDNDEDGGVGDIGDMVTMKFPSDNEDGGGDAGDTGGIGDMVTMKFPSDNEDGGTDSGHNLTLKFPSDNEDGGAGLPDIGPDIVPDVRPEVNLGSGALQLERDINKAAYHGHEKMAERVAEIMTILTSQGVAIGNPEAERGLMLEQKMLSAFMGGFDAIEAAIKEIDDLLPRAMFDEAGYQRIMEERALLVALRKDIEVYNDNLNDLGGSNLPADKLAANIFKAAFYGGDQLKTHKAELERLLQTARMNETMHRETTVELKCLDTFMKGGPGIEDRMQEIDQLLTAGTVAPDASERLGLEYGVYKRLLDGLNGYMDRVKVLDDEIADAGALPQQEDSGAE